MAEETTPQQDNATKLPPPEGPVAGERDAGGRFRPGHKGTTRPRRRSRSRSGSTAPAAGKKKPTDAELREGLASIAGMFSLPFAMRQDRYCASIVATQGAEAAELLVELARTDERVRRVLEGLVLTSTAGAILMAGARIAIPIAAHHGRITAAPELFKVLQVPLPPGYPEAPPEGNGAGELNNDPSVVVGHVHDTPDGPRSHEHPGGGQLHVHAAE